MSIIFKTLKYIISHWFNKRAEHWVVVSGIATAINGEDVLTLTEAESTYIPIGTTHGLKNKTNEPLEIIEV